MDASEKSEQPQTPSEQVENPETTGDERQHREILSAAELAGQDAVRVKLSWRSWVRCHLRHRRETLIRD